MFMNWTRRIYGLEQEISSFLLSPCFEGDVLMPVKIPIEWYPTNKKELVSVLTENELQLKF